MDKRFLKELKNNRTAYEKSCIELKNPKEWNVFAKGVKKKVLNNPNEFSIDISTDSNIWPKNKNNMPIAPEDLYLALQKELMLKCSYSDQMISIFPGTKIRKWKYINRWYLTIGFAIIAVLTFFLPPILKVEVVAENSSYSIGFVSLLFILFSMYFGLEAAFSNLVPNTRRQFKQLFGK